MSKPHIIQQIFDRDRRAAARFSSPAYPLQSPDSPPDQISFPPSCSWTPICRAPAPGRIPPVAHLCPRKTQPAASLAFSAANQCPPPKTPTGPPVPGTVTLLPHQFPVVSHSVFTLPSPPQHSIQNYHYIINPSLIQSRLLCVLSAWVHPSP
ncbi:uncharacterized protein LOC129350425 [Amphiprion ocellaris]|uniref:uncharacterized protein LOC129350425 n=1 Tax=Amphiprion ocellaris TaxID=80972 RepID=UPI0024119456|nr:uncharacterized protein LOC129350425 [Amphiprion ocellaris]